MIRADAFYHALGRAIKQRRESLNLTQSELGDELGLSRTSITNIERGRQRLLIDQFCRLAEVLRCHRDELLSEALEISAADKKRKAASLDAVPATVAEFVESLSAENRRQ